MTSWLEIAQSQAPKDTFLKRITTLDDFSNACTNSSFLAIRIKDMIKTSDSDRVLLQVGLAYLPSLESGEFLECSSANMPSLIQFYNNKRVKALTVDVHIRQDEKDEILALRDIPVRRNVRFGKQITMHPNHLGAAITGFLQGCLHSNERNLVFVGFNSKAWKYMRDCFPRAMSHFSAYMDSRDIARDAAPHSGHIPGLRNCLELFHFDGELAGTEKVGEKTDNAGEHAVAVCAFANILLSSWNQQIFRYRIECAYMSRHWESKKVRLRFTGEARFLVSVCTEARETLPYCLKSSWRVAQEFHAWNPHFAVRVSQYEALVQFHNKPDMQMFIKDMNGEVYPSGETLSVTTYEQREKELQEEPEQQDLDNQQEEEEEQQDWGQSEWSQQQENHQHACGQQEEKPQNYWDQQEECAQPQEWDFEKKKDQQEETSAWNSVREYWTTEEENEEEEDEEEEDGEMPELVEVDPAADWDLLSE